MILRKKSKEREEQSLKCVREYGWRGGEVVAREAPWEKKWWQSCDKRSTTGKKYGVQEERNTIGKKMMAKEAIWEEKKMVAKKEPWEKNGGRKDLSNANNNNHSSSKIKIKRDPFAMIKSLVAPRALS